MRALLLVTTSLLISATRSADAERNPLGPPTWRAFWVWGRKNFQHGPGYFRLTFRVKPGLVSADWQGVGDDSFVQYVNGIEVLRGGFAYGRTYRRDVTELLREGENLLAALCHNAAEPGGWLSQLTLVYADGTLELVVSDRATRFWHEEQEGWNQPGFDDSRWEPCRELGRPPAAPWGPLTVHYAGPRQVVNVLDFGAPRRLKECEARRG
ncbi:MAG: hypothetical protein ACE5O2_01700 [Armatimonadota bacterium]